MIKYGYIVLIISTFLIANNIFIDYEKYIKTYPLKQLGDENIKYLVSSKDLNFTLIDDNNRIKNIKTLIKSEIFLKKYKEYFKPFNRASLTKVIIKDNKAFLRFGYYQDVDSIVFGDFLLIIKDNKLLLFNFGEEVGCTTPVKPIKE